MQLSNAYAPIFVRPLARLILKIYALRIENSGLSYISPLPETVSIPSRSRVQVRLSPQVPDETLEGWIVPVSPVRPALFTNQSRRLPP